MKITTFIRIIICGAVLSYGSTAAFGINLVSSTFDTNLEMWTGTGSGNFTFHASGGNPGGYVQYNDVSGTGGDGWLSAPAKFLGNWSALENQSTLSWDHIIIQTGGSGQLLQGQAIISGPGGSARFTSDEYMTDAGWKTFSAPINYSAWAVTAGSWADILNNVTTLQIRIEAVHNDSGPLDIDGIDNVTLNSVPEPATLLLLGLGGLAMRAKRS
jgi:hypothetical protein